MQKKITLRLYPSEASDDAEIKNNSTDTHPLDFIEKKGEGGI
jgi:hypothetical protein